MLQIIRTYWHFLGIGWRIHRRAKKWRKDHHDYVQGRIEKVPFPAIVQIIPTEHCNLRCGMCNQWGDKGYFLAGERKAAQMPIDKLIEFLEHYRSISPDFTLSIHGGEPFLYRHLDQLLDYIAKRKIDTLFSTNGTLLDRFASKLALINSHTFYLLSIDGGEEANDRIRGEGITEKIKHSADALKVECKKLKVGNPKFIVNYCLSEHNPDAVDDVAKVAKQVGATFVNYNLRWFMPEEKGLAYDQMLEQEFQARPTHAWRGWVVDKPFEATIEQAIDRVYDKMKWFHYLKGPPFFTMIPKFLSRQQAKTFYHEYEELFGIKSCIMPSYWARIHSSGELIYCPGHPDIVPGNVFESPFEEVYHNAVSNKLRKKVEKELMPICNRCCGLYMTYTATRLIDEK